MGRGGIQGNRIPAERIFTHSSVLQPVSAQPHRMSNEYPANSDHIIPQCQTRIAFRAAAQPVGP